MRAAKPRRLFQNKSDKQRSDKRKSDKQFLLQVIDTDVERGLVALASALCDEIQAVELASAELTVGSQGQNLILEVKSRRTEVSAESLGHIAAAGIQTLETGLLPKKADRDLRQRVVDHIRHFLHGAVISLHIRAEIDPVFKMFDQMQPYMGIAVCAQTAACFGVFLKSKNSEIKNVAASSVATGLFGITEPAIYGVTLRFKKPFICGCIGGAVGSLVASFFGTRYFVFAGLTGFLSIPNAIYNEAAAANCEALGTAGNYSSSIFGVLIGTAVACVLAAILVQIVGFDDPVEIPAEDDDADAVTDAAAEAALSDVTVCSPMNGELVELSKVPDATFADGILGQGAAILPSEGRLYSPVDGTVASVFDTKHAISLVTDSGAELLIHVGLETVSLGGKYFTPKVKDGDKVKAGDLLMEFDLDSIKKDFKTFTPVLVTNADDYASVDMIGNYGPVKAGEPIYTAKA